MKKKVLVVGAGIAGSSVARLCAEDGFSVDVYEKEKFVSGACLDVLSKDFYKQLFGAHIFRTDDKFIWDWINRFGKFNQYQHKVLGMIDGELIPIPFNLNSLYKCFSNKKALELENILVALFGYGCQVTVKQLMDSKIEAVSCLGNFIYDKVFKNYTIKQWGTESVDESVLSSIKIRIDKDDRYFKEKYQGLPECGWTCLIKNMLSHKNISVYKNKNFTLDKCSDSYDVIFYSGRLDELFDYMFGELPYRGLSFDFKVVKNSDYFKSLPAVVNYPNNYDFTRISYFNKLMPECDFKRLCYAREYPAESSRKNDIKPFYPIKSKETDKLYKKYFDFSRKTGIIPIGRLGLYRYMNINDTLKTCFDIYADFKRNFKE